MEGLLNLIVTPVGMGLCVFILLITLIFGWVLYSYVVIKMGEDIEYLTPKMKKKYYDEFMFKIGAKEIMKEEKYKTYLLKAIGNSILLILITLLYVIFGIVLAFAIGKYYLWVGLIIGFTYWIVRKIVKKYKTTKYEKLKLVREYR